MAHPETEIHEVFEPSKPSKLERVKSVAITAAFIGVPVGVTVGLSVLSYRMVGMQLETAKLNLEAAKLNKLP